MEEDHKQVHIISSDTSWEQTAQRPAETNQLDDLVDNAQAGIVQYSTEQIQVQSSSERRLEHSRVAQNEEQNSLEQLGTRAVQMKNNQLRRAKQFEHKLCEDWINLVQTDLCVPSTSGTDLKLEVSKGCRAFNKESSKSAKPVLHLMIKDTRSGLFATDAQINRKMTRSHLIEGNTEAQEKVSRRRMITKSLLLKKVAANGTNRTRMRVHLAAPHPGKARNRK
ncbi:hypothetical protein F511_23903 [Dorcoceras hygrometricum]|uniref:Uncharacterized protein n=1 Tax=Dorcoceras hygrometricum TaxID=472368 RepID=A0A2Z7A5T7_9LAMI|nr:hypothetical protein F511_23903 [Dorcoceras hygrometricum]